MALWAKEVKKAEKKLKFAIVAANNHYAGFGILIAGVAVAVTLYIFFGWLGTLFAGAFWIWNIIDA